jgi:hypothetical protein
MSKKHGVVRDMEQDNLDLMADDFFIDEKELTDEELDEVNELDEVKEQVEIDLFKLTHNYVY